ncbi:hypothetical protein [Pseudoxanthomonas mexicana]
MNQQQQDVYDHDRRAVRILILAANAIYKGDIELRDIVWAQITHTDECPSARDHFTCTCQRVLVINKPEVRIEIDVATGTVTRGAKV